jgi:hypothetical protein
MPKDGPNADQRNEPSDDEVRGRSIESKRQGRVVQEWPHQTKCSAASLDYDEKLLVYESLLPNDAAPITF